MDNRDSVIGRLSRIDIDMMYHAVIALLSFI